MTNEEAINVINVVRNIILKDPSWLESFADLVNEAVDKAFEVLEAQEKAQEVSNNSPELDSDSGELISRDAALKACYNGWNKDYRELAQDIKDLPPAQPEPIRINLNELIKVKLTDWGKEIYYHQYDRTNQIAGREICKPRFPREDENGYTEFQLWCFIELYGMHMGMALPNVIEPLEIVYERRRGGTVMRNG